MKTKLLEGWKEVELGEICKIDWGNTSITKESYVEKGYPAFSASGKDGFLNDYEFEGDAIILSAIGARCGKCFLAKDRWNAIKNTIIIRSSKDISIEFIFYQINNESFWMKSGAGQPFITLKSAKKQKIRLPFKDGKSDLKKQQKIVAVLEKAEKVKEMRKEADKLSEDFLKAVFLKMFGGFLFSNKTHTEPLENVLLRIESGWSPICEPYPRINPEQTAILKLGSVTYGFFDPLENKYLPPEIEIIKKITVKKNDLLFSRKNTHDLVAATAFVFDSYENLLLPDTIFKLVYDESKINGIYLWKLLSEANFKKQVQNLATGSAGSMPNISKERLMKFEIPIPPISLQEEFAFIVQEIESMKNSQKQSKEHIENLLGNILQKAFKGELAC